MHCLKGINVLGKALLICSQSNYWVGLGFFWFVCFVLGLLSSSVIVAVRQGKFFKI